MNSPALGGTPCQSFNSSSCFRQNSSHDSKGETQFTMNMKTQIPEIIETYFRASNANDIEGLVSCFSTDAVVTDENEAHQGATAIKDWSINVRKKYEFKADVLRATQKPGAVVVTAKL